MAPRGPAQQINPAIMDWSIRSYVPRNQIRDLKKFREIFHIQVIIVWSLSHLKSIRYLFTWGLCLGSVINLSDKISSAKLYLSVLYPRVSVTLLPYSVLHEHCCRSASMRTRTKLRADLDREKTYALAQMTSHPKSGSSRHKLLIRHSIINHIYTTTNCLKWIQAQWGTNFRQFTLANADLGMVLKDTKPSIMK